MYSASDHPRCRWVSSSQIWWNLAFSVTCSPVDPLQWMGAVRMRVQTADKNITIIHTTPVHQLMSCEEKSCVFVRNKSIKTFLNSNCCFWLKYKSIIHNNASSSKKVPPLLSFHIKIHWHICLKLFRTVFTCKHTWWVHISFPMQARWIFRLRNQLLWTCILAGCNDLKWKMS